MSENTRLMYKNRPLVRCGNEIYYGNMTDKFIILLKINTFKKIGEREVPDEIEIQLLYTDPDIKGKGKLCRSLTKNGMNVALDFADAWLNSSNG